MGVEPMTSSLPRKRSTTELQQPLRPHPLSVVKEGIPYKPTWYDSQGSPVKAKKAEKYKNLERAKGIEPSRLAWKARALPLSYARLPHTFGYVASNARRRRLGRPRLVGREGFEPPKAMPTDLQSAPFDHLGISPLHNHQRTECSTTGTTRQRPSRRSR